MLLGGGPIPPAALQTAVELVDVSRPVQVAVVTAAAPWQAAQHVAARQQQFDDAGVGARVVDLGLADRDDAEGGKVIDVLTTPTSSSSTGVVASWPIGRWLARPLWMRSWASASVGVW